ncbi:MAG: hypothetical protein ACR2KK_18245 [Acidimicrobiales bacterium]
MPPAYRLTLAGLALAVIAVVVGTTVVPTHVTFGAGSIRCGTVLHPDRDSEVAPFCGLAGADHLRAALLVGAFLVVLACMPAVVHRFRPRRYAALWAAWAVTIALVAVVGVASLGVVEYMPDSVYFDL